METRSLKQSFLEDNTDYKEVKPGQELTTIGGFQDVDEIEDEVWLLQCPKGFDIESELNGQKLKLPGRTHFNTSETVAVEYVAPETRSFGYCNRKGRYCLRLLPIKGNILLRARLKATEKVTLENAEAVYPPQGRMILPDMIKVRHPLHGHQYEENIRVDKAIVDRLKRADEISANALYEAITNRKKVPNLNELKKPKEGLNAASDDDDVTFISEIKTKKSKNKRKHSDSVVVSQEMEVHTVENAVSKKKRKSHSSKNDEEVAKELQWIRNL